MLGTSDAWSMSCLSHRPVDPAYYIENCRILGMLFQKGFQHIVVADRSDLFDAYSHYVKMPGPCMSAKTIKGILCHKEVMLVCVAIKKLIEKRLQILSVHLIHSLSYFLAPNK